MSYVPLDEIWAGPLLQWTAGQPLRLALFHKVRRHTLIHMTKGQALMRLGGQRHGLGANAVVFVPAGAPFSFELGAQGNARVMLVPPDSDIDLPADPALLRLRHVDDMTSFNSIMDAANLEAQQERAFNDAALEGYARLMRVWLLRQLSTQEALPLPRDASARLSQSFFETVAAFPASQRDLTVFATRLGVGSTHLSRACKEATGKTAAQLLREAAMHAALDMMTSTDESFGDIATKLGYGSAAYFTRAVQSQTGQSPSALRRAAQGSRRLH